MDGRLLVLALMWLAYFFVHSLLASLAVKRWVARRRPEWMPAYRLFFNTVALVGVVPPVLLAFSLGGEPVIRWSGPWRWVADGLALAALAGFVWSLRWYDGSEFIGLRQLRAKERRVEDQERFCISPLHRHVRHPWYFLGLVLVWTRDLTPALLVSAVMVTLYFVIGSRLEERKLRVYHGRAYEEYCRRVPGLVPLPWKRLSAEEARRLEAAAGRPSPEPEKGPPPADGDHQRG